MASRNTNPLDSYLTQRMEEWAEWHWKVQNNGLGHYQKNILAKLKEEGGVINRNLNSHYHFGNNSAEEIQFLLRSISKQDALRGKALEIRYLYPKEHEAKAELEGYTRSNYYSHLRLAHEWMKGYLSAKKSIRKFK